MATLTTNGRKAKAAVLETLIDTTNEGAFVLDELVPYTARVVVEGTAPILFHAWSVESVEEKAKAAKGSKAKKHDDVESYVRRDERGCIAIPGEYFRQAIIGASRYQQDPRSPRKSAMDLFKAGIVVVTELCSLNTKQWDYLDRRRVTVQRAGITRERPAMRTGWSCSVDLTVLTPEYIDSQRLHATLTAAGRLIGVGDFRPTYGRFQLNRFEVLTP